jgi:hypothetical protein
LVPVCCLRPSLHHAARRSSTCSCRCCTRESSRHLERTIAAHANVSMQKTERACLLPEDTRVKTAKRQRTRRTSTLRAARKRSIWKLKASLWTEIIQVYNPVTNSYERTRSKRRFHDSHKRNHREVQQSEVDDRRSHLPRMTGHCDLDDCPSHTIGCEASGEMLHRSHKQYPVLPGSVQDGSHNAELATYSDSLAWFSSWQLMA